MPPSDRDALGRICRAISDPTRREIYDELGRRPGMTTAEISDRHGRVTRWAVMKHLAVLREAGLLQTLPQGRRRHHFRDERGLAPLRAWIQAGADSSRTRTDHRET